MKEKEEQRLNMLKAEEEKLYIEKNMKYICGIDEAGRGPLAGPVVVGAVVMPRDSKIEWVNDSKKVTEKNKICLLSPTAASYGFFKNFEEKGEIFKKLVGANRI